MKRIFILSFTLLLTSRAIGDQNYAQIVSSWHGTNIDSLIRVWGKPDAVENTFNGGKTYIFHTEHYNTFAAQAPTGSPAAGVHVDANGRAVMGPTPRSNDSAIPSIHLTCAALFTTNNVGKIIATDTQGSHCVADDSFITKHSNPQRTQ